MPGESLDSPAQGDRWNFKHTSIALLPHSQCHISAFHFFKYARVALSAKIKGTTGTLKICVRDHECEDGDKISVEVEGSTIFSGEIDNDWDCYNLTVWSGESYAVELTAINGTGYKGDCSYRDENTGEIRVTGENTETQVWRHRGGAGSKARIIVERVR